MSLHYTAHHFHGDAPPASRAIDPLGEPWDGPHWAAAEEARIEHFHAAGSSHRPVVRAKLMYDAANLYLRFRVEDRFVVANHTEFQDPVWQDSCVEFFVQPRGTGGYFNFEINCGGALLSYYIEDPTRTADGFAKFTKLSADHGQRIRISHSLPGTVIPERPEPSEWHIACAIPVEVLEAYAGPLGSLAGQTWRGNFYKCADGCSHPHWASWAPIGEELNFHQPKFFAPISFAREP
jgi:hypothetical protein